MVTRSQLGIVKPIERLSLHTSFISPITKSPFHALKDPNLCNAMNDEYNALVKNGTWIFVPRPSDVSLVRSMWLFKHKFYADGTLSRYKAQLVANGSSQQLDWPIHQLDVKNAFLNGDLSETVYMHQPPGYATQAGFSHSQCDSSLFIYTQGSQVSYLLIYVDDIILTDSTLILLQQIIDSLHKEFDMTDLGALNYFLGISAARHSIGLFLSQKKYALQLLEHAHMGILEFGLHLYASATTSLVGYTDIDWAGFPFTRWSTSGYYVFLNDNLLSWSAKRQHTISCSSAEADGRINCMASKSSSAVYMSAYPVQHERMKHIEIDIHFVRDMVKVGHVRVLHVPSRFQYAYIFTKGLLSLRSSLSVRPLPVSNCGDVLVRILL
ncbi:ribonuclease H-like domain-containing protein [Tanacetum coccineum]|uniref:Ribonuclease H-like domain-containing protein n=1 Tax=Tanacetum coccineum TaxID=301880 RepID=A0ABQ4XZA2_9ASTR